jgi:chemotaxis protein CheC
LGLTPRQVDALKEVVHLGAAQAASMLARLVADAGVWVDVPMVVEVAATHLPTLLGGVGLKVGGAHFAIDGLPGGSVWWLLPALDAQRLGDRLLKRITFAGTYAEGLLAALREAANIVASASLSAIGTLVHAPLLPTTPAMVQGPVERLVEAEGGAEQTVVVSRFFGANGPMFEGALAVVLNAEARNQVLTRLGQM